MIARSLLSHADAQEVRIFYSYARRDATWREQVDRLLPEFEWDVAVRTWYDGEIEPGTDWAPEIDRNLAAADIILLFVGQAFVDSRYCREVELPAALVRHARGEARVVPIIIEETDPDWRHLDFAALQVLPKNGVPVSAWGDPQGALAEVVQGLVDLVVRDGLHHDSRMRWEVHLDGGASSFMKADRQAVTTELRRFTGDASLRSVGVRRGSVVLLLESTQDAVSRAMGAYESGALQVLGTWKVLRILRLFGAGVRAASTAVGFERPDPLPGPERMLLRSPGFTPALMKGIMLDQANPLRLNSIIDPGDSDLKGEALESESRILLDYFLTDLAVPADDIFVNLAPDENVKLLSESLKGTRLGAGLLEFDYRLKRLAASLLHPDLPTGRVFWKEVTDRCRREMGEGDIPLSSFQRIWVVPDKATVYEGTREGIERIKRGEREPAANTPGEQPAAFVVEYQLKAMTEHQYLADRQRTHQDSRATAIYDEVFRDVVLPEVQEEVNGGESFAEFRQIYCSMILATWFKREYRDHPRVAKYIESGRPDQLGIQIIDVSPWATGNDEVSGGNPREARSAPLERSETTPAVERIRASSGYQIPENREYFERYMDVFAGGVFYVERDELLGRSGRKRARAYFAGGIDLRGLEPTSRQAFSVSSGS